MTWQNQRVAWLSMAILLSVVLSAAPIRAQADKAEPQNGKDAKTSAKQQKDQGGMMDGQEGMMGRMT